MLPLLKKIKNKKGTAWACNGVILFTSFVKIGHLVQMLKDTNTRTRNVIGLLSFNKKRDYTKNGHDYIAKPHKTPLQNPSFLMYFSLCILFTI